MTGAWLTRTKLLAAAVLGTVLLVVTVVIPATGLFAVDTRPTVQEQLQEGVVRRVMAEQTRQGPRDVLEYQLLELEVGGRLVTIEQQRTSLDAAIGGVGPGD